MANMIHDLREREIEFAVFDVLNRLHQRDENSNNEMAQVVQKISRIGQEAGCSIGIVHHVSKENGSGRFFTRIRGASAIHGWTEWSIGLTLENSTDSKKKLVRRAEFETKAAEPCFPISFTIERGEGSISVTPESVTAYDPSFFPPERRYRE